MTFKSKKASMPFPVKRAIEKFGKDLALARRRHRFPQKSMAERIGISLSTLQRLEKGDPNLAWGTIARALHVLGKLDNFTALLDVAKDDIGLVLLEEQLPQRIRRKKTTSDTGAL